MTTPPRPASVEELQRQIEELQEDVSYLVRVLKQRPSRVYARAFEEPIAVSATEVARLLSIKRERVYQLHHAGILNGFRIHPKSDLKFLVSEVREIAKKMSDERRDA